MKYLTVPNQIFVGCPWKTVRQKYENIIEKLIKKFPLSYVIIGRSTNQNAEVLLDIIKDKLLSSSFAIFDASGGNANVSLEYGIAEAENIPNCIYLTRHKRAQKEYSDSAIIADLAGKNRNEYKQLNTLHSLLTQNAQTHPFTKKFERFSKKYFKRLKRGGKKSARALSLKIIHYLDGKDYIRRSDLVQDLNGEGYSYTEINENIRKLSLGQLIKCTEGRYSRVSIMEI